MKLRIRVILPILLFSIFNCRLSHSSVGQSAFTSIPSRFKTKNLTLSSRALGETCISQVQLSDGTVCNPSFLHYVKEPKMIGSIFFGNGYSALSTVNNLVNNTVTQETLRHLFEKQNTIGLEANVSVGYYGKNFSASYSPYRVQYFSEIHNPNLPVIAIHASIEQHLTFSYGNTIDFMPKDSGKFSFGVQTRLIKREFVHGSFTLPQVLTEDPSQLLPNKQQYIGFINPSLAWVPESNPLGMRLSLAGKNFGFRSSDDPLYVEKPDFEFGVGMRKWIGYGKLDLGIDITDIINEESILSRFRLGAAYQIGVFTGMIGINQDNLSLGMQFDIKMFRVGISYEFIRSEIQQGNPENLLATELGVEL